MLLLSLFVVLIGTSQAASLGIRSLQVGTRGDDVHQLQHILAQKGYNPGPADGIFGARTEAAVKLFQQHNALPVIGIVGPRTTVALLSPGQTTHAVRASDSLFLLAQRYGSTVQAIKSANGLVSDTIYLGQKLVIGGSSTPTATVRATLSSTERDILARIVHAEAQGEPFTGKVAVAAVIFNRVDSNLFPNTVGGVIYQPWQFEPVLNGWINKPADAEAYRAVDAALTGQDPTKGAVFFYNPVKAPHAWMATRPVVVRIGNHVFMY